jgi:RHS repeat-associated protein
VWAGVQGKTNHESLNTSALPNNQLSGFGYDAAGNMTSNGTASYVYDAENRLIATAGYSYIYDADGQRVEKCTEGSTPGTCASGATGTLYWRGLGSDTLRETDLAGNLQNNYIFFNGQRVARSDSAGTAHYYFSDHLGSHGVVETVTTSGTVSCDQDIDYYPYGGVQTDYCSGSGAAQNYKFNGKERDAESGLDNFGARYDSSSLGRFMTPDWAAKPVTVPYAKFGDPQTLNLYSFVENGPVNRIDPDGHEDGGGGGGGDPSGGSTQGQADTKQPPPQSTQGAAAGAVGTVALGGSAEGTLDAALSKMLTAVWDFVGGVASTVAVPVIVLSTPTQLNSDENAQMAKIHAAQDAAQSGPKAADAPGVTAGGQRTDQYGNKVGPSGKPQVNEAGHSSKKGAKDAARQEGKGAPEKHSSPTRGDPHYHPTDRQGEKIPNSTHHTYPD